MIVNNRIKKSLNTWMATHYKEIKERLALEYLYDDDVFHDAYIKLIEDKSLKPDINYFEKFRDVYIKISQTKMAEQFIIIHPDELFFQLRLSDDNEYQEPQRPAFLTVEIQRYVKHCFPANDYKLWNCRFIKGISVNMLTEAFGISHNKVTKIIGSINDELRHKFAYAI